MDLINRQAAINALICKMRPHNNGDGTMTICAMSEGFVRETLNELPSAQPTLYGYNIEHLALIARLLQKENLPPERIVEVLTDIGKIVAIVRDEYEEILRKAVEQCMI